MNTVPFDISFSSDSPEDCIRAILELGIAGDGNPHLWNGDRGSLWTGPKSISSIMRGTERSFTLTWNPNAPEESTLGVTKLVAGTIATTTIRLQNAKLAASSSRAAETLAPLPFSYCAASSVCSSWGEQSGSSDYRAPGFSDGHCPLGWFCAFKGTGHDRLASRRWLEFGPWLLLQQRDLSLVQFHELRVEDDEALAQARVGHERMGIAPNGGFIQGRFPWRFKSELTKLYDEGTQTLLRVVSGAEIDPREMLEAAALKLWQPLSRPVRQVAYIFMEPSEAQRYLHELWLRGLEVRVFLDGNERRIDEQYNPLPAPPSWVANAKSRDAI